MGLLDNGYGQATRQPLTDPLWSMDLQGLLGSYQPRFSPLMPMAPMPQQQPRQAGGGGGGFNLSSLMKMFGGNGGNQPLGSIFNGSGTPGAINGSGSANPFTLNADMAGSGSAFGGLLGGGGGGDAAGSIPWEDLANFGW